MTEEIIIKILLTDMRYFIKVYPYLNPGSDFEKIETKVLFKSVQHLYEKYNKSPNIDELILFLEVNPSNNKKLKEEVLSYAKKIRDLKVDNIDYDILIDSTETYVRNMRHMMLIEEEIKIREGSSNKTLENIQAELLKILQLSFKSSLGHDYIKDALKRFEEYGKQDSRLVSSGISIIDQAGGGKPKSLTVILASSNVGKCYAKDTKFKIYVDSKTKKKILKFLEKR